MSELKVGDEIWTIDPGNRRNGWERNIITGETRASWLVGSRKVSKHTMLENHGVDWGKQRWFSPEDKVAREFVDGNCHRVAKAVTDLSYGHILDVVDVADKLKKIAEILGMELTCSPES